MRRLALAILSTTLTLPMAAGARPAASIPAQPPVIVELFTSEGCSSCPPADQLLTELVSGTAAEGTTVIGLSEHVDYWDHLGWKDPYSNAIYSDRQTSYGRALKLPDVYTPQMIVDGTRELVGQDRASAISAIRKAAAERKTSVQLSWTAGTAGTVSLSIAIDDDPAAAGQDVWVATTEDGLSSSVSRGENQGRRLTHSAVVRKLVTVGRLDRAGSFRRQAPLTIDPRWRRESLHAVVFVQAARLGRISAAGQIGLQ